MTDVVFFGIQGAGKGTQSVLLQQNYSHKYSYFSSGELFRTITSQPNAIGNYLRDRLEKGDLIHDELTIKLFHAYLFTVIDDNKSMLLDGFPRTASQLSLLIDLLKKYNRHVVGIHLVLDEDVVMKRTLARGRADDTPDAIAHRIDLFNQQTVPMISAFAEHFPLASVNADQSIYDVHDEVLSSLSLLGNT